MPLTAEVDTYTTHKWDEAAISMDSHSLSGIAATDFEVIAADAPIDLTYDCLRDPNGGDDDPPPPPPTDPLYANGFDR